MTRKKKLYLNILISLIYQITTIVCGIILPKFFIPYFGSKVNGLVSSITQFLGIITLLEAGVGAVVQSSLYKPLATKDDEQLSKVVISSQKFFNKIMIIMLIYVLGLMIIYPNLIHTPFNFLYVSSLILILAFSYMIQHYLYLTYRLLLNADQLSFIQLIIHTICLILNTISIIILIKFNASIHVVELVSMLVFALQPIVLKIVVNKRYNLDLKLKLTEEPIKQKWNGFAQHISSVILGNTDTVVLTLFSTLDNVSIYSVYYLVTHGVKQILSSLMSGFLSLFGNMIAREEHDKLNNFFTSTEFIINNLVLFMYTMVGILIIPFIKIYTFDFTDANYIVPSFAIMITLAYAIYSLRTPYEMIIKAAGHYKQTQTSSIIEATINIVISVIFVFRYGLIGVAVGTFIAMTYRTFYLVWYLSKNILKRKITIFLKLILLDMLSIALILFLSKFIAIDSYDYISWIIYATKIAIVSISIIIIINVIFSRKNIVNARKYIFKK